METLLNIIDKMRERILGASSSMEANTAFKAIETKIIMDFADNDVPFEKIKGRERTAQVVDRRNMLIACLRQEFGWTYPRIGKLLNKHHSTCIHSLNTHNNRMDTEIAYKNQYQCYLSKILSQ